MQIDGISVQPYTVDRFEIFAGQRYSVVVNANKAVKNYWIRAPMQLQHSSDNNNRAFPDLWSNQKTPAY